MDDLIVDMLAAARISRLVTTDTFPPVKALREVAVDHFGAGSSMADLIDCNWCAGFWISAGVYAARRFAPRVWGPVAVVFATSMVTGLAAGWSQREGDPKDIAEAITEAADDDAVLRVDLVQWCRDRDIPGGWTTVTDGSGVSVVSGDEVWQVWPPDLSGEWYPLDEWRARNRAKMEEGS